MGDRPTAFEMMGDPRAEFLRSEHDTSWAMEPYRNTPGYSPSPHDAGHLSSVIGAGAGVMSTPYGGRFEIPRAIARALLGGVGGYLGGQALGESAARDRVGQRHMDTYGSEERIGAGMTAFGQLDPRDPRRFRVYAP
jgi:hypothetical protein